MSQRPIRILLVDDHPLIREGLCRSLEAVAGFSVVGSESDAEAALEVAPELAPDVVLLDIDMPGRGAFEAARALKRSHDDLSVIFLSAYSNDRYVEAALSVKASGYVTKSEPPQMIIDAIHAVARGELYFSPAVQERIVIDVNGPRRAGPGDTRLSSLSSRELEVLRYLGRGLSRREMAELMQLSVRTVENHCINAMAKLDIHDRVQLARFAIREGLVEV